jgi:hypothetical protein
MEEYLLTHGTLNQVETGLLGLLGDQLSSRGRQNLAEILTVHESYSRRRYRQFTSAMPAWMHGWNRNIS